MKKILSLLLLIFAVYGNAQSTCPTANTICSGGIFTITSTGGNGLPQNLSISNPVNDPFPPNSGCLKNYGPNPTWLLITVVNSGMLGFSLGENSSQHPQAGFYDWIMWPYSSSACADILNNSLAPVRCNWNGSPSGGTGIVPLPAGANTGNYEPALPVTAGDKFLILMDNFSGVSSFVVFNSTGTASLNCTQVYNEDIFVCPYQIETYTVYSYGLSNPSYTLNPGNQVQTSPVFTINSSTSQIFTISVAGTNTFNSTQQNFTSSFAVNVASVASLSSVGNSTICEGESIGLLFSPAGNFSISVTGPNGYNNYFSNQPTGGITISPLATGIYSTIASYTNGCSSTSTVLLNVEACTDLNRNDLEAIRVWPNPAKDYLYFTGDEITGFDITDFSGATWKLIPEGGKINLSVYNEGIYTLTFYKNQAGVSRKRILILH